MQTKDQCHLSLHIFVQVNSVLPALFVHYPPGNPMFVLTT